MRETLTRLFGGLSGITVGRLLEDSHEPMLKNVYSALAVLFTVYVVYKIPVLLLLAYGAEYNFYPFDLFEHWSASGIGLAFTIVYLITFGLLSCVLFAPLFIEERQRIKGKRKFWPYAIWALLFFPLCYLVFTGSTFPKEVIVFSLIAAAMTAWIISTIIYRGAYEKAQSGAIALLLTAISTFAAPEYTSRLASSVLRYLGIGGALPVVLVLKESQVNVLAQPSATGKTINGSLILLGPKSVYVQIDPKTVDIFERENIERIRISNAP